jgi:hypothetical protein
MDTTIKDSLQIVGKTFERLTCKAVAGFALESNKRRTCYMFECSCGSTTIVRGKDVTSGATKSCGCLHLETSSQNGKKNKKNIENENPAFLRFYGRYEASAKKRGYNFTLTKDEFKTITKSNCHYCGIGPIHEYAKGWLGYNTVYKANGIDRKNNEYGYTLENSLPCCSICNHAKHTMQYDDFKTWIDRLKQHNN